MASAEKRTEEATDLLQHLIRNQCVNDGTQGSGHERRSADLLVSYLENSGADVETFEPEPGRTSLVAKIEGSDPSAPSLTLLGHTDVVPPILTTGNGIRSAVSWSTGWSGGGVPSTCSISRPPWPPDSGMSPKAGSGRRGRSPISPWPTRRPRHPRGQVAVPERGGCGQRRLCDHRVGWLPDGRCGRDTAPAGHRGREGRLLVPADRRGTPGHGGQPLRTDNALVKAAEVVRRIEAFHPQAELHEAWTRFVEGIGVPPKITSSSSAILAGITDLQGKRRDSRSDADR